MEEYIAWSRQAPDDTILDEIGMLRDNRRIWESIPSGNRDYLEKTLNVRSPQFVQGARQHLAKAWPHRVGYIYFETGEVADDARGRIQGSYGSVSGLQRRIGALSTQDVWRICTEAVTNPAVQRHVWQGLNQRSNKKTLDLMIRKRNGLEREDQLVYSEQKRMSVSNILRKVVIPQLMGSVAKSFQDRTG